MFEDDTWKHEISEKDQIIALTTKLTKVQPKFEQQVALFATQAANNKNNNQAPTLRTDLGSLLSKKEP